MIGGGDAAGFPMIGGGNAAGFPMVGAGNAAGFPMIGRGNATGFPMIGRGNATGFPMIGGGNASLFPICLAAGGGGIIGVTGGAIGVAVEALPLSKLGCPNNIVPPRAIFTSLNFWVSIPSESLWKYSC